MPTLPHPPWPFRLGATVQQDSLADREASLAIILCTPRGQRPDEPSFGVTSLLFGQAPADTNTLLAQVVESDPRLDDISVEDVTLLTDATVARLHIDLTGE